jgi:hypothetical protein
MDKSHRARACRSNVDVRDHTMILEVASIKVRAGQESAFEAAFHYELAESMTGAPPAAVRNP